MIIFRKLENTLIGVVDGKPFNIPKTPSTLDRLMSLRDAGGSYDDVMELIKHSRNETIAGKNEYLVFNPVTENYYLHLNKTVSKFPIPSGLVKYIEESFDKDIDFMPVIKAWVNLLANPRVNEELIDYFNTYITTDFIDNEQSASFVKEGYNSNEAESMSTYPDIAITQEGLLATYKVAEMVTWEYIMEEDEDGNWTKVKNSKYATIPAVIDDVTGEILEKSYRKLPEFKEDILFTPAIYSHGDRFFSGKKLGYVYEVGKVQSLPEKATRNLKNTFGGGGLYIGGLNYVKGYNNDNTEVLTCFVNPGDILSFQSRGKAIRVDSLMPNNVWLEQVKLKGMYHSSDYAKLSDDRLKALISKALEAGIAVGEDFREMQLTINKEMIGNMDVEFDGITSDSYDDEIDF